VYPELSYTVIGLLYDVNDELGSGHKERYYENALEIALKDKGFTYKRQLYAPVVFKGNTIGRQYFDFLIENKMVLELKTGDKFTRKHIDQVYEYLRANDLKLGIIAQFSSAGLKYRRVVNVDDGVRSQE